MNGRIGPGRSATARVAGVGTPGAVQPGDAADSIGAGFPRKRFTSAM
jgi:hypothetical protein